jgi:hypothetical protein
MRSILKSFNSLILLTTLFTFLTTASFAEASYKIEINHLLNYVKNTKCLYERNGDLHSGVNAHKHISKKYEYFKDDIYSAEDFIRLSATQSTVSGRKYHIICPDKKRVESGKWLLKELHRYRSITH